MHAFAISKISFRSPLSSTQTLNGFRKYIRCDNELNRFMSAHSWVQLLDDDFFFFCSFFARKTVSFCVSCLFSIEFVTRTFFPVVFTEHCMSWMCVFFFIFSIFRTIVIVINGLCHTHKHFGLSPFDHFSFI